MESVRHFGRTLRRGYSRLHLLSSDDALFSAKLWAGGTRIFIPISALRVESRVSPAGQRGSPTISPSHLQFRTDCSLGTVISPSSEGAERIAFSAATRIPRRARGLPGVDK